MEEDIIKFERKIKEAEERLKNCDNNNQIKQRERNKQIWLWISFGFWWTIGFIAGAIIF